MSGFVNSGIAPLDRQIGGLVPGRPYLVSGNPGTGKSTACLEFVDAAVQRGERALLLTHDDPGDLLDSAEFLGIDLGEALITDKVRIVTFQLDFVRRYMRAATPTLAFEELLRLVGDSPVQRIAIDSIVPFLEGGGAGSQSIFALVDFLDAVQATALITYPGDLAGLYDQRLEPLLQRAGGVFHLTASEFGRRRGSMQIPADVRTPIVLVTPFHLRASDRTRTLRAGADDFISAHLSEPEFVERLRGIIRRGRSKAVASRDQGVPTVLQPMDDDGRYVLFDGQGFAGTVASVVGTVRDPFFTVLCLQSPGGDADALAGLLVRVLRVDSGDFVGRTDDTVLAFLDGARPGDLGGLLTRIREKWSEQLGPPLQAEVLGFPGDTEALYARLGLVAP